MANYLLDYRGFKAILEAASDEIAQLVAAAKAADSGTEVLTTPGYNELMKWWETNGAKFVRSTKSLEYWAGDVSSTLTGGNVKGVTKVLSSFTNPEETKIFIDRVIKDDKTGNAAKRNFDVNLLAKNAQTLITKLESLNNDGWQYQSSTPVEGSINKKIQNFTKAGDDKEPAAKGSGDGQRFLGWKWRDDTTEENGWPKKYGVTNYTSFNQWYTYFTDNFEKIMSELEEPKLLELFKRKSVDLTKEDKITLINGMYEKAKKRFEYEKRANKDTKLTSAEDAITAAGEIYVSFKGVESKTTTTVVSEPETITKTDQIALLTKEEMFTAFANNSATLSDPQTLIQKITSELNPETLKAGIPGFTKLVKVNVKVIASTNVVPTTSYENGNAGLAKDRVNAMKTTVVTPALKQLGIANIATIEDLPIPDNSNATTNPGSEVWTPSKGANAPEYAAFRFSTIVLEITYETSETTEGKTVDDISYAGDWKITINWPSFGPPPKKSKKAKYKPKKNIQKGVTYDNICAAFDPQ